MATAESATATAIVQSKSELRKIGKFKALLMSNTSLRRLRLAAQIALALVYLHRVADDDAIGWFSCPVGCQP
jgi:hypothetical protein